LLPPATAVVVIVCLIQAIVASPVAQFGVLKSAVATILYSSNLYFAHIQSYYFADADAPSALLHTWSLTVEELTSILVLVSLTIIAAIALPSFFGSAWPTARNPVMAFFESPVSRLGVRHTLPLRLSIISACHGATKC